MRKIAILFYFLSALVFALSPSLSIEANGTVKDMVLRGDDLVIATDNGVVQVYDTEKKGFIKSIILPKIKDFMGDEVSPRVFSVDRMGESYLLLSESGKGGYSNLWLEQNNHLSQYLFTTDKKAIVKARFVDEGHILLGFLSNEVALWDVATQKERYRVQLSESKFSDFALNEDRTQAVFACESGVLSVIETATGKVIKMLKGVNVDNVYQVGFVKNIIVGAGQDRRGSLYNISTGKGSFIQGEFLIYSTGLSPSGKIVAFTMDEENTITLYNTQTKSKIVALKGQKSTLNRIIFKEEKRLFSSSDDSTIMMWDLK